MWHFPNWQTILALILGALAAFYFEFSNFATVAAMGFAFCVGLVTARGVDRSTVKILLVLAALFFAAAIFNASMHDVGLGDLFSLNTRVRSVSRSMSGFYVCVIGAAFIEISHRI